MKVKTSELTGAALDWMVAKCEHAIKRHKYGSPCFNPNTKRVYETEGLRQIGVNFAPSTNWSQGGPIIEREGISVGKCDQWGAFATPDTEEGMQGPTILIAAMRCYVASKFGEEVEIPDELMV